MTTTTPTRRPNSADAAARALVITADGKIGRLVFWPGRRAVRRKPDGSPFPDQPRKVVVQVGGRHYRYERDEIALWEGP